MKRFLILTVISVLGLSCFTYQIQASGAIIVSPPLKEIVLGPGLVQTSVDITIQNTSDQSVTAGLSLLDLRALTEFGGTNLAQAGLSREYDLANWMSLPGGDKVKIDPKSSAKVEVVITNRSDLTPGGHYGAVLINTSSSGATDNVQLSQQIASLLFIKKTGGEVYSLDLEKFEPDPPNAVPNMVSLGFKNTGNVHVLPRGFVEVADPDGVLVAKAIINPDSSMVLPGQSREILATFQSVTEAKKSGKYTITAYYRHDDQADFSTKTMYFEQGSAWSKHAYLLIPVGFILLVIIYVIRRKKGRLMTPVSKLQKVFKK